MSDKALVTYGWLMAHEGAGDAFDRHILASMIAVARAEADRPLTEALGLSRLDLARLLGRLFPHATGLLSTLDPFDGTGEDALEEEDLRDLLLEHRDRGIEEEAWIAAIIARRSLLANHLWQDLGLGRRTELTCLMDRHFPGLARANDKNMKWKKFFYRELCQREGVVVCKSPNCEVCEDYAVCFEEELGSPLFAATEPGAAPTSAAA